MSSKWRQKMNWKSNLVFLKMVLWSVLVFKYLHCAERCTVYIFPSQHNVIWVVHNIQNGRCHCLINCFWTDWKRLFRVPWTARRSNQSILKEISPEYSLEGLMLKLKLQNFGHLIWKTDSLEKTLMLRKIEGRRRREWQRITWLDCITDSMDMSWANSGRWSRRGKPGVLQSMGSQRVGHDWAAEQQRYHLKPESSMSVCSWPAPEILKIDSYFCLNEFELDFHCLQQ